jgi:hypothetical protein
MFNSFFKLIPCDPGVRGSTVGRGAMLQAGRLRIRVSMRSLNFLNLPNPSSCTMATGFTMPLTEMSTRRYFWA